MLQRLQITLAQVKAGNTPKNLLNELLEIIYSLYQKKKLRQKLYSLYHKKEVTKKKYVTIW